MPANRKIAMLAIVAAASITLAACGGSKAAGNASSARDNGASASGVAVQVTEKNTSISVARTSFTPGTYTFEVKNAGSIGHNLTVKGPGVDNKATPTINPGSSGQLTVTLQKGSYELYCSIDSHKDLGMDLTVHVG